MFFHRLCCFAWGYEQAAYYCTSSLRYFWELIFSRKLAPPTSSNAWMIKRKLLDDQFGGFESVKGAIQPEVQFAARLVAANKYRFLISTSFFGVGYEKKWRSQLITSVRLLFPLFHKQTLYSLMICFDLFILVVPFIVLMSLFFVKFQLLHGIAIILCVASLILYGFYTRRVWNKGWIAGAILWPLLVIQEVCLIIASIVQYKRKAITWKGRPIQSEAQN